MNNRKKLERSGVKVGGLYWVESHGRRYVARVDKIDVSERPGRGFVQIMTRDMETGDPRVFFSVAKFCGEVKPS